MPSLRPVLRIPAALSPKERAGAREEPVAAGALRAWRAWAVKLGPVLGLVLCLLPTWVLACPTCVERAPESVGRSALLVGAMLLLPFLLVALGVWAAVRTARGDAKRSE